MMKTFTGPEIMAAYTQLTYFDRSTPEGEASSLNSAWLTDLSREGFPSAHNREFSLYGEKCSNYCNENLQKLFPHIPLDSIAATIREQADLELARYRAVNGLAADAPINDTNFHKERFKNVCAVAAKHFNIANNGRSTIDLDTDKIPKFTYKQEAPKNDGMPQNIRPRNRGIRPVGAYKAVKESFLAATAKKLVTAVRKVGIRLGL